MKPFRQCGIALSFGALLAMPELACAKPISYPGGTMVMLENDETGNTVGIDYTLDPRFAAAFYYKREIQGEKFTVVGPQANLLVKRWNLEDGQGNIFAMTGAGSAIQHGRGSFAAWTGLLADYETRRIFTSYEIRLMHAQNIENSVWQRARVGFAPYLGNYDDWHTWFMVQVDHHPAKTHATTVTPLVRFFYKTFLIETGASTRGTIMFNLVQQF
jgi:hypothetical protein